MRSVALQRVFATHLKQSSSIRSFAPAPACRLGRSAPVQHAVRPDAAGLNLCALSQSQSLHTRVSRNVAVRSASGGAASAGPSDSSADYRDGSDGAASTLEWAIRHWDATSSRLVDSATLPFVFLLLPQVRLTCGMQTLQRRCTLTIYFSFVTSHAVPVRRSCSTRRICWAATLRRLLHCPGW